MENGGENGQQAIARGPVVPVNAKPYMAHYTSSPLIKKLDIKPNSKVALWAEPDSFIESLGEVPESVTFISKLGQGVTLALWFVRSSAELAELDFFAARLPREASLWIFFPKQSSPLRADFNKLDVQAAALRLGLVDYKVCSVDDDWSGMKFKRRAAR